MLLADISFHDFLTGQIPILFKRPVCVQWTSIAGLYFVTVFLICTVDKYFCNADKQNAARNQYSCDLQQLYVDILNT